MNRLHKIAVIGAGSWGTALSMVLATRECEVVLWTPEEAQARQLAETRRSPVLSKTALPLAPNIHPTCDLGQVKDAELIVVVVPSVAMRSVAQRLRSLPVQPDAVIVSCTKGIEQGTHKRMTEILQEYLPSNPIGVLSGPNHAEDICLGLPSASLIGFEDPKYADWVQQIFASKTFRVYSATDIIGMQLGGTIKNVFAIGAGLCEGLNLGDNAQAALLTRGLAEMTRTADIRLPESAGERPNPYGAIQPSLWEDGAGVHALLRTSQGYLYRTDSEDLGRSWSQPASSGIPNNNSGIDLVKAPDGTLYLACNPVGENWGARSPISLLISKDGGAHWEHLTHLVTMPGEYSYPAVLWQDGCLLITHTWQRKSIQFWKIRL